MSQIYSFGLYFWYMWANIFMLAQPLVLILVLNHTVGTQFSGLFGFWYAVSAPIYALLSLNIRVFVAVDDLKGGSFIDVIAQRIYMFLGILLALLLVLYFRQHSSGETLWEAIGIIISISLLRFSEGLSDASMGYFMRVNRARDVCIAFGCRFLFGMIVFTTLILSGQSLSISLGILAIVSIFIFYLLDFVKLREAIPSFNFYSIKKSLFSLAPVKLMVGFIPAALVNLANVFDTNVPRYTIEKYVGLNGFAAFLTVSFVLAAISNMVVPFFTMGVSTLGRALKDRTLSGKKLVNKVAFSNVMVGVIIGVILLIILLMTPIHWISLITGIKSEDLSQVIIPLGIWAALSIVSSGIGYTLTALGVLSKQTLMLTLKILLFLILIFCEILSKDSHGIACASASAQAFATLYGLLLLVSRLHKINRSYS